MKNFDKYFGITWIVFFTGMTAEMVGKQATNTNETYQWTMVPIMFAFLAIPYICGYLAGKKDGKST